MMPALTGEWEQALSGEFKKPYYNKLYKRVKEEYKRGVVYPPAEDIFNAFHLTPLEKVKVVILGQDPYHEPGQAHGLCFSVKKGVEIPPSLVNIYKELHDDIGCDIPTHGDLTKWASQGVLLLNTVLTVRAHQANSLKDIGWEEFTDAALRAVNEKKEPVVYLLWGSQAQKKEYIFTPQLNPAHLVLKAPHPSPLSAYRGFFGCRHFSKTNEYLISKGIEPIDWSID